MAWVNFDDVLGQMLAFGLVVDAGDLVVGQRRRCRHKDGGREKRGWFQLYELPKNDGSGTLIVGSFGAFFGAENLVQKIELPKKDRAAMTTQQMDALRTRIQADKKRADAEAARKADECARRADHAWRAHCKEGSRDQSEYLKRKQIEPHGGRFLPGGKFAIPLQDTERRTFGLQVIYDQAKQGRDKSFWPAGLAKKGHFFLIGGIPDRLLLVAEGFATAASIQQATGLPVAVAFDAGNLLPVAKALKAKYKRAKILICADDDYRTEGNPGLTHAQNAALAVDGGVSFPIFADERPTDTKGPTDFNDLHLLEGIPAVARQIESTLSVLGWSATKPLAGSAPQGSGEPTERKAAQSVMDLDDIVERFIPLDDGTGDYVFDTWTRRTAKRSQMIALLPAGVRSDDIKRHPLWISRGAYFLDEVGFDPSLKNTKIKLNTWQGWPMTPVRGPCDNILDHLRYLVSKEENAEEVLNFILDALALPLQQPGAKLASAMIFHGDQGSGKSLIFDTVMSKIYGDAFKKISQRRIENQFTDWARNRLFVVIEEISASSDIWHIKGEFKDMVTSDTFDINDKNEKWVEQRNMINFVLLSNEQMPIPLENGDRRHLVVYTPPKPSDAYIAGLIAALEEETPHFYAFLLDRDLSNFHRHKRPPMTTSKQRLINISLPSEAVFINEWIDGQIEYNGQAVPFCPCLGTDLYSVYSAWAKRHNIARPRDIAKFIGYVSSLPGWEAGKAQPTYDTLNSAEKKNRKMVVPSEDALEKSELSNLQSKGGVLPRGNSHKNVWLTEGFFKFRNALGAAQ